MSEAPTVRSELNRIFPQGTAPERGSGSIDRVPLLPTDVFAAAAHLLEASGAYQYVVAPFERTDPGAVAFSYSGPTFSTSQADISRYQLIGREWAEDMDVGSAQVQPIWTQLIAQGPDRLVAEPNGSCPDWWKIAHALLVVADEACSGMGYQFEATRWANEAISLQLNQKTIQQIISPSDGCNPTDIGHVSHHVARDSVALIANREVVRVLPKGRTTEIGCSPRTLSHNLALLPPHGHPNAYWHSPPRQLRPASDAGGELNVLLIPYPYVIPDGCFVGMESHLDPSGRRWGRYRIQQRWLHPGEDPGPDHLRWSSPARRASFVGFVDRLIEEAEARSGKRVNAVVLPEYAVDWATYDTLVRHLRDTRETVEFVVSGVSVDCNQRLGNQVTTTIFYSGSGSTNRTAHTHSRRKHHRWLLDRLQIEQYGLQGALDPDILWWEYLEIETRIQPINVFRSGSTLTAVICEDLARVDPGLSLLRNLGPNLVFALLMDGPQLAARWPGIYATGLADDPGSSVLSLTSLGLITRSNAVRKARGKRVGKPSIALWKHRPNTAKGGAAPSQVELKLARGELAKLLTLKCDEAHEITIDGRSNRDATAWCYAGEMEVKIPSREIAKKGWKWILTALPPETPAGPARA